MMSINPDAHSVRELDHMHWGVLMARKGGVPADRVLNAMSLSEITRFVRRTRRSFARATANLALFGTGSSGNMSEPGTGVA
jgi:DNA polymerase (family 10)